MRYWFPSVTIKNIQTPEDKQKVCFNYFSPFFYSVKTLDDSRAALLKELASSVPCFFSLSLSPVLKVFTVIVRRNNIIASLHFTKLYSVSLDECCLFSLFFFFKL